MFHPKTRFLYVDENNHHSVKYIEDLYNTCNHFTIYSFDVNKETIYKDKAMFVKHSFNKLKHTMCNVSMNYGSNICSNSLFILQNNETNKDRSNGKNKYNYSNIEESSQCIKWSLYNKDIKLSNTSLNIYNVSKCEHIEYCFELITKVSHNALLFISDKEDNNIFTGCIMKTHTFKDINI